MKMDFCVNWMIYIFFIFFGLCHSKKLTITDKEYSTMPPLFHLDNYDNCMLLHEEALYCYATIQLSPIHPKDPSDTWKIIKTVISQPKNYRHDRPRYGICVPVTCPQTSENKSINFREDNVFLTNHISKCFNAKFEHMGLEGCVTEMHCENAEPFYSKDISHVVFALFLILLIALVVYASFFEGLARYKSEKEYAKITSTQYGKVLSCFSVPKNWSRLNTFHTSQDGNSLKYFQGVRCFNMGLVIMSHACMVAFASPTVNPKYAERVTESFLKMLVVNGSYAVQTFFFMSGWLLSYNFFVMFEGNKKFKWGYIGLAFLHRYMRLTPCLLVMAAFNGTWLYHLGRGPIWDKLVGDEYRSCRTNWWTNVLYINNYYNKENMCLQQTWYLASDTQLFVVSLILVAFMWKYQKHIVLILSGSFVVAVAIPGIVNWFYDYDILIRTYPEPMYQILLTIPQWHRMYSSGYTNGGGYVIGITFGYIFYKCRGKKVFTTKISRVAYWIICWTLPLSAIFVARFMYEDDFQYSRLEAALYVALGRNIFAFGIAFGIFGITQGIGWYMGYLLAWSPFQLLGRLTYCAYLVHVSLIKIRGGQIRSLVFMEDYLFVCQTMGDIALAYIFAVILCLFVEMPTSALQKLMLPQLADERGSSKSVAEKKLDGGKANGATDVTKS